MAERWAASGSPDLDVLVRPMTDGGDGFLRVVRYYRPAVVEIRTRVRDALSNPIETPWGWDIDRSTAYVESAAVVGLATIASEERRPLDATSYGLGQLIGAIGALGVRKIVLGLGGSATVDGGLGMARALGYRFEDDRAAAIERPRELPRLRRIVPPAHPVLPRGFRVTALVDVVNPLLGEDGAAKIFGPQKGASPEEVTVLGRGLERLAARAPTDLDGPSDIATHPGGGAAGGLGAGCRIFLGARLARGAVWCARLARLDAAIDRADAVITGEGRFDVTSRAGKASVYVVERARRAGVPVAVVSADPATTDDPPTVDRTRLDSGDGSPVSLDDLATLFRTAVGDLGF